MIYHSTILGKYLYKVVVLSNKSLHIIDKYSHNLSEEQRVAYEAEVRALSTFLLLHYGYVWQSAHRNIL